MPLSLTAKNSLRLLVEDYRALQTLPYWKKTFFTFFYPAGLEKALRDDFNQDLEADNTSVLLTVCQAISTTWFFQRWLISSLSIFSKSPIMTAYSRAKQLDLFTQHQEKLHFTAIASHPSPLSMAETLNDLRHAHLPIEEMAQENREVMSRHDSPTLVANVLKILEQADLSQNLEFVLIHANPVNFAKALTILKEVGLLNETAGEANADVLLNHPCSNDFIGILKTLQDAGLLNQARFDALLHLPQEKYYSYYSALYHLYKIGLLSGERGETIFSIIVKHPEPYYFSIALIVLSTTGLLVGAGKQTNLQALAEYKGNIELLSKLLQILQKTGLLTGDKKQGNWNALINYQPVVEIYFALEQCDKAGLLSEEKGQAIFDALVNHRDPWSLAYILVNLNKAGLLTGELAFRNLNILLQRSDLRFNISEISIGLLDAGLLAGAKGQINFEAAITHPNIGSLSIALSDRFRRKFWNNPSLSLTEKQSYFEAILKHPDPTILIYILDSLLTAGLLTGKSSQANCDLAANYQGPNPYEVLNLLTSAKKLNQQNFNNLMKYANILLDPVVGPTWGKIPIRVLTSAGQVILSDIFNICEKAESTAAAQGAFNDYVDRILAEQNVAPNSQRISFRLFSPTEEKLSVASDTHHPQHGCS